LPQLEDYIVESPEKYVFEEVTLKDLKPVEELKIIRAPKIPNIQEDESVKTQKMVRVEKVLQPDNIVGQFAKHNITVARLHEDFVKRQKVFLNNFIMYKNQCQKMLLESAKNGYVDTKNIIINSNFLKEQVLRPTLIKKELVDNNNMSQELKIEQKISNR